MLSVGAHDNLVHSGNMGLSRGGYGREYARDAFGLDAGESNVLQQQLNELIQNSYLLHQNGMTQCSSLSQTMDGTPLLPPSGAVATSSGYGSHHGLTSMGFSQSDIDRNPLLFDDYSSVVDPQSFVSVSNVHASVSTFAPVGSHLFVGMPSSISQQPQVARERWVDGALPSARGLKREAGLDQINNMQPARKNPKLDKSARTIDAKSKRPSEQADHILRERQRRDDMTSKFAVLESLLPIGVKRDRSTIVDDSIEYVKNLHHRIKSLQERKAELNSQSAAAATSNDLLGRKGEVWQQPSHGSPTKNKTPVARRPRMSEDELNGIHSLLRSCLEKMEVHGDLPNQVVIEMVCKPQPRLQSNILMCLENLNLDVMQCSITKIAHRLICVIAAKPQEASMATSGIVAALKGALQG